MATSTYPVSLAAPQSRARSRSTHTAAVLTIALALRAITVGYVLQAFPKGWFFTRGVEMPLLAKSLLSGQGLSSPFGGGTGPSAMVAPAYPLFTALVFHFFGIETQVAAAVMMSAHIALNLATIWMLLTLARKLTNERGAVAAALIYACSPPLFELPTVLWETSFSAFFMLVSVAWAVAVYQECSTPRWQWAGGGAGIALAGLFNPALLPSLVAVMAWLAWKTRSRSLNGPALALVTFVAVFSPWPLRNAKVFHAFIPTRTTVGCELWIGNHPGTRGYIDESMFPYFNPVEMAEMKAMGETGYCDAKSALAKDYVRLHLLDSAKLTAVRFARFWSGTGTRGSSAFLMGQGTLMAALGFVGLWRLGRSPHAGLVPLFLIPLTLFQLPYILTHAEFRYRIVIDGLLCVLAAVTLRGFQRKENAAHQPG